MCGPELGSFSDLYAVPFDAASSGAASGPTVVSTADKGAPGSITFCVLRCLCEESHLPQHLHIRGRRDGKKGRPLGFGLQHRENGDAYLLEALRLGWPDRKGFKNVYYGGLDSDSHGNLVSTDALTPQLWIYRGCDSACTVVGAVSVARRILLRPC